MFREWYLIYRRISSQICNHPPPSTFTHLMCGYTEGLKVARIALVYRYAETRSKGPPTIYIDIYYGPPGAVRGLRAWVNEAAGCLPGNKAVGIKSIYIV